MALWWWVVSAGVSWCHKCGGNITELRTFSWVNPSKRPCSPKKNAQKDSRKSKERSRSFLSHLGSFEVKEEHTWITMTSRSWKNQIKNDRDVIVIVFLQSNLRHYDQKPSVQRSRSFEVIDGTLAKLRSQRTTHLNHDDVVIVKKNSQKWSWCDRDRVLAK
jgi:hypothetical protein